jgi:hypothetical protein
MWYFPSKGPSKRAEKDGPLVIPALPNRDFRQAAVSMRTRKMYNPAADRPKSSTAVVEAKDVIGDVQVSGGISMKERRTTTTEVETESTIEESARTGASTPMGNLAVESPAPAPAEPETEDQRALRELLGGDRAEGSKAEDLVIKIDERQEDREESEVDNLKRDIESRPDEVRFVLVLS